MGNFFSFLQRGRVPAHTLATHLQVCSPDTAFRRYPTLEMRHWCTSAPGILFPFGLLRFPGGVPRNYLGGLCKEGTLFLFIPQKLYISHRHALLRQLTYEDVGTTDQSILYSYCERTEERSIKKIAVSSLQSAHYAEDRVRQVSYWLRFLAFRQEAMTPHWRW